MSRQIVGNSETIFAQNDCGDWFGWGGNENRLITGLTFNPNVDEIDHPPICKTAIKLDLDPSKVIGVFVGVFFVSLVVRV